MAEPVGAFVAAARLRRRKNGERFDRSTAPVEANGDALADQEHHRKQQTAESWSNRLHRGTSARRVSYRRDNGSTWEASRRLHHLL